MRGFVYITLEDKNNIYSITAKNSIMDIIGATIKKMMLFFIIKTIIIIVLLLINIVHHVKYLTVDNNDNIDICSIN